MAFFMKSVLIKLAESNLCANQLRYYARWTHRRPRRVLFPDELKVESEVHDNEEKVIELNPQTLASQQPRIASVRWTPKNVEPNLGLVDVAQLDQHSNITPVKKKPKVKKNIKSSSHTTDMLETIIDAEGNFIYTKLKDNDPNVSKVMIIAKSRKQQIKKDLILLEGKRLIREALMAKCILKNLIFSRKSDVEYLKPHLPKTGAKLYKISYREIQMWSDLITTPGIMGIFKTPEVEKYEPHKSLPLTIICDNIREPGNIGAVLRTAAGVGAQSVVLSKGCVDLWDPKVLRSACGAHFRLQIHQKMDWSDIRSYLPANNTNIFLADNKIVTESCEIQDGSNQTSNLKDIVASMPILPYYGVKFNSNSHMVLIVGGETEGICEESYRLAADFNGIRLNIPLSNDIESLNTGTALGIIIFEIKRQLSLFAADDELDVSVIQ